MKKHWSTKKFPDLTGKVFNRLTVIEYAGPDKWKNAQWKCSCSCGKEIVTLGARLRAGSTQSCGCYSIDRTREAHTTEDSYFKRIFRNIKCGAKRRKFSFELTEDFVYKTITSPCYYCGINPHQIRYWARHNKGVFNCNGVDRKDSSVGYIENNCVPCCSICNVSKMDYSEQEFLQMVERIYLFRIKKS